MAKPTLKTADRKVNPKNFSPPLVGASIGPGLGPLRDFQRLKMGNIVLINLPDTREEALAVMRCCRENRIYVMLSEIVHRANHRRWHGISLSKADVEEAVAEAGEYFVGRYVIGEAGGMLYWPKAYTIHAGVGAYSNLPPCRNEAEAHRKYVDYLRGELAYERTKVGDCTLFNVESSLCFSYQAEAGVNGQCLEMLPGDPALTLSAIRGTARAYHTIWGAHIAMFWYGGIRMDALWLKRWRIALLTAYLAGAEFIYPESGHLEYHARGEKWYGFDSPELLQTRRELRNLYRLTQIHNRPPAGPETPVAVVQGADDGHPGIWNPYVWGQYNNGREWETSDAEKGWALFDTLFHREELFHENVTGKHNYSGNPPGGQVDVIPPAADFSAYQTLLFIGYNRMNDRLYRKLIAFVRRGGHLVIWLSHFDNADKRGGALKLFRNGDLSELCGFRVTGRRKADVCGMKYFQKSSFAAYDFPVRTPDRDPYFIGRSEPAKIECVNDRVKALAAYSGYVRDSAERMKERPVLVERRLGRGAVFTVTTFTKPGAVGMRKFAENLVRITAAAAARHAILNLIAPDAVRFAVYDAPFGKIVYVLNTDPDVTCGILPEYRGSEAHEILLAPGVFRILFLADNILFIPSDPACAWAGKKKRAYSFQTNEQKFAAENLGPVPAHFAVNGTVVDLKPGERGEFVCRANIPRAKAEFFDPAFLDEEPMRLCDSSTPY